MTTATKPLTVKQLRAAAKRIASRADFLAASDEIAGTYGDLLEALGITVEDHRELSRRVALATARAEPLVTIGAAEVVAWVDAGRPEIKNAIRYYTAKEIGWRCENSGKDFSHREDVTVTIHKGTDKNEAVSVAAAYGREHSVYVNVLCGCELIGVVTPDGVVTGDDLPYTRTPTGVYPAH